MNYDQFKEEVLAWAAPKGLLAPDNATKQALKLCEEAGELIGAYLKGDIISLEVGDIEVVTVILAAQLGVSAEPSETLPHDDVPVLEALGSIAMSASRVALYRAQGDLPDRLASVNLGLVLGFTRSVAHRSGFPIEDCYDQVMAKIKGRTGDTINGVFVKH